MNKLIAALVAGLFATAAFAQASGTMAPAPAASDTAAMAPAASATAGKHHRHHKAKKAHKHHPIKAVEKAAKSGTNEGQSSAAAPKN